MTILRRLDCILEPTRDDVRARLLEREYRGTNYTAPIDVSDLLLKNVICRRAD